MPGKNLNPYDQCPVYTTGQFTLRLVEPGDAQDLLACYSDPKAARFFNADNCTSDFCFQTLTEMQEHIDFWLLEYSNRGYVRFSILDDSCQRAVGTVEIFTHKVSYGKLGRAGMLRIDLMSPYENEDTLTALLELMETDARLDFQYDCLITKAIPEAGHRRAALHRLGYVELNNKQLTPYEYYYVKTLAAPGQ